MIILIGEDMLKCTYDVEQIVRGQERVMQIWRAKKTICGT